MPVTNPGNIGGWYHYNCNILIDNIVIVVVIIKDSTNDGIAVGIHDNSNDICNNPKEGPVQVPVLLVSLIIIANKYFYGCFCLLLFVVGKGV